MAGASKRGRNIEKTGEDRESFRLKTIAKKRKILTSERISAPCSLPAPPDFKLYDRANINKKNTNSRTRKFLFVFPGELDIEANGGKLGTLDNLSSKNPVLYIDFPKGRLKMLGTILYPKKKYMAIQYKGIFDSLVVFSEHEWLGEKKPQLKLVEKDFQEASSDVVEVESSGDSGSADENSVEDGGKGEGEIEEVSKPTRRSGRAVAKVTYQEWNSGDENDVESD
ncbi:hypothetical protein AAMO2058_000154200 [Amorphochlora amoebiformis]